MCREFEYEDEYRIEALRRRLIAMTRDGQLIYTTEKEDTFQSRAFILSRGESLAIATGLDL